MQNKILLTLDSEIDRFENFQRYVRFETLMLLVRFGFSEPDVLINLLQE